MLLIIIIAVVASGGGSAPQTREATHEAIHVNHTMQKENTGRIMFVCSGSDKHEDKDVYIERDVQSVGLDPSQAPPWVPQHDPVRDVGSRLAIDATKKHPYPAISLPPKEHLDLVASRWKEYGIE